MSFLDEILSFVTNLTGILDRVERLETDIHALTNNILKEVTGIKHFNLQPKWRTRVINVPRAFDTTKSFVVDIANEIHDTFFSLLSNLRALRQTRISPEKGKSAATNVLAIITEINNFVNEVDLTVQALGKFVDELRRIREEIEGFDSLFLPQGNSRMVIHNASPRIRIGSLQGSLHPQ